MATAIGFRAAISSAWKEAIGPAAPKSVVAPSKPQTTAPRPSLDPATATATRAAPSSARQIDLETATLAQWRMALAGLGYAEVRVEVLSAVQGLMRRWQAPPKDQALAEMDDAIGSVSDGFNAAVAESNGLLDQLRKDPLPPSEETLERLSQLVEVQHREREGLFTRAGYDLLGQEPLRFERDDADNAVLLVKPNGERSRLFAMDVQSSGGLAAYHALLTQELPRLRARLGEVLSDATPEALDALIATHERRLADAKLMLGGQRVVTENYRTRMMAQGQLSLEDELQFLITLQKTHQTNSLLHLISMDMQTRLTETFKSLQAD